ncbi:fumarylacetoacetate hydrolase family protein [Micromonospora cathayae]|uniref:Fumarylacetoacetate hydrolase family protein n=1 Tax=Micromonospora cathayae TaxID=3028804 RepID=A0ABY7ZIC7_9ACTN|nr:fumarylacetoacetate hydrolase family protein [Micromonospora sp. HUAS 3]WDZ82705.1 fumarylacetoacetate hydrolase family protein [Micromonospora sp. HUAS 3]
MKLLRVGAAGQERPAALDADGRLVDLSGLVAEIDGDFLAGAGVSTVRAALASGDLPPLPDPAVRVGPPIARPGKIVCVGVNYSEHASETVAELPTEPILFMKASNTVVGPDDQVLIPRGSSKTDWEVELAVVIGRPARYLETDSAALACVAGYTISNDVSEREFQLERGGQWDKGKSCETFNPLGPWLVTADEVPDPQRLGLRLSVNGQLRQDGSTRNMVFGVAEIVRYVSQFMVLEPGDVINTGTPGGVALGLPEPKPYLRAGDVIEVEIDGLGRQRQTVGQA